MGKRRTILRLMFSDKVSLLIIKRGPKQIGLVVAQ